MKFRCVSKRTPRPDTVGSRLFEFDSHQELPIKIPKLCLGIFIGEPNRVELEPYPVGDCPLVAVTPQCASVKPDPRRGWSLGAGMSGNFWNTGGGNPTGTLSAFTGILQLLRSNTEAYLCYN